MQLFANDGLFFCPINVLLSKIDKLNIKKKLSKKGGVNVRWRSCSFLLRKYLAAPPVL
jgi:hypothetical protein